MSKPSSNKIVFYNALSTVLLYAISFFSAPVFSQLLGTSHYGVVQVYNTWNSFLSIIIGLMTRGILPMARAKYTESEQARFQSSAMGLSVTSFAVISVLMIALRQMIVPYLGLDAKYLIVLLIHSFGNYCVLFINAKFTYEMKANKNLFISVTLAIATFGLSFILLQYCGEEQLYAGRIFGMAIPYGVAGLCSAVYIFKEGKLFFNSEYWKFALPLCIPLIFHGIAGLICSSSDRIMIQQMISLSAVGIYALSYNFASVMNSIWVALNNSWAPFMIDYIKNNQYIELKDRSSNYIRLFTCLCMGFVLLTPEVFHIFADVEYWEGAIIIPIVVMCDYINFIYAFAANYEFCFMRTDFIAVGTMIAGLSNIVLNLICISLWGYFGAAVATLISNAIMLACHVLFARKLAKEKWIYNTRMFVKPICGILATVLLYYVCYDMWFIRWLLAGIVGIYMLRDIFARKSIF